MMLDSARVAELFNQWSLSEGKDGQDAFALVYVELKRIAARYPHRERNAHAFQATGIVHET